MNCFDKYCDEQISCTETSFGDLIWRPHLETSFGDLIWRPHLETSFGDVIWRSHLETSSGISRLYLKTPSGDLRLYLLKTSSRDLILRPLLEKLFIVISHIFSYLFFLTLSDYVELFEGHLTSVFQ